MEVHVLDLQFQGLPQTIAAYLVEGPEGFLLVESGPTTTLPELQRLLTEHGLSPADIKHLLVTHIHLDHAGAAGWWAQQGTKVYVHHVGAPHLIDPGKLLSSATRIYGDQMDVLWGEVLPAPAENIISLHDGDTVEAAGLTFTALDTPGHAYHHHVYRLDNIAFTGDAAGIRLPASSLVDLPAPPPEFNLPLWQQTLDRIEAESFAVIYPTHFGPVTNVAFQLSELRQRLQEAPDFVRQRLEEGTDRDELVAQYVAWNRQRAAEHGLSAEFYRQYEMANPLYMSVDGMIRYWRKQGVGA